MKHYMQTMAAVIDGSHIGTVELEYFDAKYVNVYRNNSVTAYIDVLRANYRSVADLVGDDFFVSICLEYIKKHPTCQRSLVGYGEGFAKFLDDNLAHHKLAYLSSFARLDRAWTRAHIAQDNEPLQMSVLENIIKQGGDLESLELFLMPDVFLVSNTWSVFSVWISLREDTKLTKAVEVDENRENVLVWRHGYEVIYRDLNTAEYAFLSATNNGANLGLATEKTLRASPATDIGQLLTGMLSAELFTQIEGGTNA